ncbi:hypothetical protein L7F22_022164 [Adiantum nelumboides]|nr:hypothetical protein [Adiantum nelumboides]
MERIAAAFAGVRRQLPHHHVSQYQGLLVWLCLLPHPLNHPRFAPLTSLKVSFFNTGLDDRFFHLISTACVHLTYLNLRHCTGLTDRALNSLATGCRRLTFLKLRCYQTDEVSDLGLDRLLTGCTRLRDLRVMGMQQQVRGWGFRAGRELECLVVEECGALDKNALAQGLRGKRLKRLSVMGMPFMGQGLEDVVVNEVEAEVVEELGLSASGRLNDAGMDRIARACERLRVLEVRGMDDVTDHGWRSLAEHAQALEELDVRDCRLHEAGLRALQRGCPRLRLLLLSDRIFKPCRSAALDSFCNARPGVTVQVYASEEHYLVFENEGRLGRPAGRLGRRPTSHIDPIRFFKTLKFRYPIFRLL